MANQERSQFVKTKKVVFTLNAHHCVLEFPDEPFCELVVSEVLTGDSYPVFAWLPQTMKVIVDIGASYGPFAIRMAATFPDARIQCYEANPHAFEFLKKNTAGLPIDCFQTAVTDLATSGHPWVDLYLHKAPLMTSTIKCEGEKLTVPAIHPRQLPEKIDILKIDIEGREPQVLEAIADRLPDIDLIYVEFHSHDDRIAIDKLLTKTHLLNHAKINIPRNGEVTYVNRRLVKG